ncbi:hypothetical protein CsSME_00038081 [Camellia sinensis var. sinensis]
MGSCYFSMGQWQELELQALIFRHMLAGATVPPQLLHHLLLKKTTTPLLNTIISSLPPPASYFLHHPLQHYHPAYPQNQELKTKVYSKPKMRMAKPVHRFFAISSMIGQDHFKNPTMTRRMPAHPPAFPFGLLAIHPQTSH